MAKALDRAQILRDAFPGLDAVRDVTTETEDVDNEPQPGEVTPSNPFGAVLDLPTYDSGHYAYVNEDGEVVCRKCGHGTEGVDADITCDVCEPVIAECAKSEEE